MMMLENIHLPRFSGLRGFSRTSKRRFFRGEPAGEVLTCFLFFLVGSGTNAPGIKSESESTSVTYAIAV